MYLDLLVLLLGSFIGIASAFLGVGGGIFVVPFLPFIVPLSTQEVIGTSLLAIFLIVLNNTISFSRKDLVKWNVALKLGPLTALGSFISGKLALIAPVIMLKAGFGIVLILFAWKIFKSNDSNVQKPINSFWLIPLGAIAGLVSGFTGVGSGVILSPILLNFQLVKSNEVSPTSNGIMCFTTLFGSMAFLKYPVIDQFIWGFVHVKLALILFLGAAFTSYFARKYQHFMGSELRKRLLLVLIVILSIRVFWNIYNGGV